MSIEGTVFIVEDDESVRDSLGLLLESHGFAVLGFASADGFIAAVPAEPAGCLLVDVRMPGMSGLELQDSLREKGWSLPVIVITGHADVPRAVQAMKGGAVDFIEKPYSETIIVESVKHALSSQRRRPDDAAGPEASRLHVLTPRERDVLDGLIAGNSNKVIAYELEISARTVEIYRGRLMKKMQVRSLSHLIQAALAAGLKPREK